MLCRISPGRSCSCSPAHFTELAAELRARATGRGNPKPTGYCTTQVTRAGGGGAQCGLGLSAGPDLEPAASASHGQPRPDAPREDRVAGLGVAKLAAEMQPFDAPAVPDEADVLGLMMALVGRVLFGVSSDVACADEHLTRLLRPDARETPPPRVTPVTWWCSTTGKSGAMPVETAG
mmetsp:Transcript_62450/g.177362  ORF Transcript_62450/g.177362 Transcript_62450/m.177362 type:complete len:177 (+) Transcript_62450:1468-1998(+)